jgi:LytS/YehU family sensor histidine kinase
VQLGELLRASLDRPGVQEIPLSDELELLQRYLAIMRTRFHDRLHVELDVDPDAHDALVPQFILQPLVENALEHGIARRAGMGRIRFSAHVTRGGEALRLAVADDGPGPPPNDGAGMVDEGVGLANTRLRLQQLYDDRQQLTMDRGPFGGMEVAIELPLRAMPRARAEALA